MDVLFKVEPIEIFSQVLEDIMNTLYNVSDTPPLKTIDTYSVTAAKEEIKNMIIETKLDTNEINEYLSTKHFSEDKVRFFVSLLEKMKNELLNLALVHYNCSFGETLKTFDWKLKLVCGSSELKNYSYPLLQLALYTTLDNHKPAKRLYEVNKDMLLRLIDTLDDVIGDQNA